jgi:catechol 2,3-dioxygenase-like lactoylglutathione lyase family enzyme
MARIRHLAIKSANPQRLAEFYQKEIGLKLLHQTGTRSYYLSDGHITLALLSCRPGDSPPGINHFGIEVEDASELAEKLVAAGLPAPTQRPATTPFAEHRAMDPDGNLFDISEHGYMDIETSVDRESKGKVRQPAV